MFLFFSDKLLQSLGPLTSKSVICCADMEVGVFHVLRHTFLTKNAMMQVSLTGPVCVGYSGI